MPIARENTSINRELCCQSFSRCYKSSVWGGKMKERAVHVKERFAVCLTALGQLAYS